LTAPLILAICISESTPSCKYGRAPDALNPTTGKSYVLRHIQIKRVIFSPTAEPMLAIIKIRIHDENSAGLSVKARRAAEHSLAFARRLFCFLQLFAVHGKLRKSLLEHMRKEFFKTVFVCNAYRRSRTAYENTGRISGQIYMDLRRAESGISVLH
jgi:hypothetical protein